MKPSGKEMKLFGNIGAPRRRSHANATEGIVRFSAPTFRRPENPADYPLITRRR
jgi:hypothetical protein